MKYGNASSKDPKSLLSIHFFPGKQKHLERYMLYFHTLYLGPYSESSLIAREAIPCQDQLRLCCQTEGVGKQK